MNDKIIRWSFDHPGHDKTWYETPLSLLDETVYNLKLKLDLPMRVNIIRSTYVPKHLNAQRSSSDRNATTPVRKSAKPAKAKAHEALAMRNLHEFMERIDHALADRAYVLEDPRSSTSSSLPGDNPAPTN